MLRMPKLRSLPRHILMCICILQIDPMMFWQYCIIVSLTCSLSSRIGTRALGTCKTHSEYLLYFVTACIAKLVSRSRLSCFSLVNKALLISYALFDLCYRTSPMKMCQATNLLAWVKINMPCWHAVKFSFTPTCISGMKQTWKTCTHRFQSDQNYSEGLSKIT